MRSFYDFISQIQQEAAAPIGPQEGDPSSGEIQTLTQIVALTKGKTTGITDTAVRNFVDQALMSIEAKLESRQKLFDQQQKDKETQASKPTVTGAPSTTIAKTT